MTNNTKTYDLEERTAKFGESIIDLLRKLPKDEITRPLITQLIRCSTSVGANYCEADDAESKMDFKHKIGICKKEARESKHFLRMMARAEPDYRDEIITQWKEAKELNLIFNSIFQKIG
ncbi:MAG TPA: four helix bundle protein [Candidatus Saccharimonadales bacterium]|nr:four helix bundle protein [Candidatus Saccharimonadales bacterium]